MKSCNRFLVLASASPRRRELLKKIPRLNVAVFASDCDETFDTSISPKQAASVLAQRKAETVFQPLCRLPSKEIFAAFDAQSPFAEECSVEDRDRTWRPLQDIVVLGADTMVVAPDGRILGKPKTPQQAEEWFRLLCHTTHTVVTGYCLLKNAKKVINYAKTRVTFGAFNDKIVYNYIKCGNPFDKAGGYGIQDAELQPMICSVKGDLDNVIGLPVAAVEKTLKEFF